MEFHPIYLYLFSVAAVTNYQKHQKFIFSRFWWSDTQNRYYWGIGRAMLLLEALVLTSNSIWWVLKLLDFSSVFIKSPFASISLGHLYDWI